MAVNKDGTRVKVELIGAEALKKKLADISEAGQHNVFKAIAAGAVMVASEARRLIVDRTNKTGHIYRSNSKSPKVHQASAPGEAPANWTGNLLRGIKVYTDEGKTTAYVAASAVDPKSGHDYAPTLEFGSDGGKIKKRPFLTPAFRKFKPTINQSIKAAIKAAKKG